MSLFLHIGLHKTSTTYLQKQIFSKLEKDEIIYNPSNLMDLLEEIFVFDFGNKKSINKAQKIVKELSINKKIFISCERISQLFCTNNYEENAKIAIKIFPQAKIIIFLRFQPDWLLSCYKQSVHMGDCQDINNFLNYKAGEFVHVDKNNPIYNNEGLLHTSIFSVNYYKLIEIYNKLYGEENINVYFYEDYRQNKQVVINNILNLMSIDTINSSNKDENTFLNRSFSSNSIKLSIIRYKFFKHIGLKKYLPTVKKLRSQLRDNIILNNAGINERWFKSTSIYFKKIKRLPFWRMFIQNFYDKFFYHDVDLLEESGLRSKLEEYYRIENKRLEKLISKELIPKKYLD